MLYRFIKNYNTTLKGLLVQSRAQESDMREQLDTFCSQTDLLKIENKKLHSRLNRMYLETCILLIDNRSLGKQLHRTRQEAANEVEDIPDAT